MRHRRRGDAGRRSTTSGSLLQIVTLAIQTAYLDTVRGRTGAGQALRSEYVRLAELATDTSGSRSRGPSTSREELVLEVLQADSRSGWLTARARVRRAVRRALRGRRLEQDSRAAPPVPRRGAGPGDR